VANDALMRALARRGTYDRVLRAVPITAPAAGADVVVTVPGGVIWLVQSFIGTLTTSAVVATRAPALLVDDSTVTTMRLPAAATQAASLIVTYTWADVNPVSAAPVGAGTMSSLPVDLIVPAGWRLRTSTLNIDVSDTWTSVAVMVEEVLAQPHGVHEIIEDGLRAQILASSLASEVGP
jgi:hypothetical protein